MKAVEMVAEQRLLLPDYMVAGRWEKELTITGVFPFSSTVGPISVSRSGLSEADLERSLLAGSRKIHVLGSASRTPESVVSKSHPDLQSCF